MPAARGARYLSLAGLAAASAAAAHGGWGELADPRWAAAALTGAVLAAAGLAWTGIAASAAHWAAAELEHGRIAAVPGRGHRPLAVLEAAGVLILSQACAHAALLIAGAPAHTGSGGAIALHLALALAAALLAAAVDSALVSALGRLETAARRMLELLCERLPAQNPHPPSQPAPAAERRLPPGRAPPLPA